MASKTHRRTWITTLPASGRYGIVLYVRRVDRIRPDGQRDVYFVLVPRPRQHSA